MRKRQKKKAGPLRVPVVTGALLLLGLFLWVLLFLRPRDGSTPVRFSLPMPARVPLTAEEAARWMDQRLDAVWSYLGVPHTGIHVEQLANREWEGERWEVRLTEVGLPKGVDLAKASSAIEGIPAGLGHLLGIHWALDEPGLRAADLWVDGYLTHRVFLREASEEAGHAFSPKGTGKLAIIMDDMGNAYGPAGHVLEMKVPMTLSLFPRSSHGRRIAREAESRSLEVMMHLPMEPWGYPGKDPGIGALMVSMPGEEVERVLWESFSGMPQVKGVNNHMGSRFTEDQGRMERVMEFLAPRGLYFVDSLTTPKSSGFRAAVRRGVRAYRRDVFLDVWQQEDKIRSQFKKLMQVARIQGNAIGICHPYPETLRLLPELAAISKAQGYEWVTVSQIPAPGG
ncbi:MAG: divergent polysaccharide deacetylase family protein [Thermodesulfobacteriota bacterium]